MTGEISAMNKKNIKNHLIMCREAAGNLFKKLDIVIEAGEEHPGRYGVAYQLSVFNYYLNVVIENLYLDETRNDIGDETRLDKISQHISRAMRLLKGKDERAFWFKCGAFDSKLRLNGGGKPDYEFIGDLILSRIDETGSDEREFVNNLMSYLNRRLNNG